jgi:hypothetical protein
MSMEISSHTIGNRTCDLPVCSAVPQQIAPPRTPHCKLLTIKQADVLNLFSGTVLNNGNQIYFLVMLSDILWAFLD